MAGAKPNSRQFVPNDWLDASFKTAVQRTPCPLDAARVHLEAEKAPARSDLCAFSLIATAPSRSFENAS
jgi:hypothetical protein